MPYQVSEETKKAVDEFTKKDAEFQQAYAQFEQAFEKQLLQLEVLRENRNAALDTAQRAMREEADSPDCEEKIIKTGPFTATKKESKLFHPEMMVARLNERDLYDGALSSGGLEEKIIIKYDAMKAYLEEKGVYPDFEDCEDSEKLTTAISGPKPIAAFGAEVKKKK